LKKKIILMLVFALVLSFALAGCGGQEQEPNNEGNDPVEEPPVVETLNISIITGSTGGTYYPLGGAMANVWTNYIDGLQVTSQPGGASVESVNRVNAGEIELGMAMNNIADDAWNGKGTWAEDGPQQNFRAIGVIYPEVYQGVALADSGIDSIEDLGGKRVAVGPVGSGTMVLSEGVFRIAGLEFDDMTADYAGFGDAASKMKDGHLDANFGVLGVPAAAIQDIMTSRDINVIEIDDEMFAKIKAEMPFFSQFIIPAGTYGNEEDVKTINCQAALYVTPDMSEDMVYEITKVFYEHASEIADAHAAGRYISLDKALDGISTPLHPGALKYYLEQGIDVPEEIR